MLQPDLLYSVLSRQCFLESESSQMCRLPRAHTSRHSQSCEAFAPVAEDDAGVVESACIATVNP